MKIIKKSIAFLITALLSFSSIWAYGPKDTEENTGKPIVHKKFPLVWNPEGGPVQDDSEAGSTTGNACNGGADGGGGAGGGCSLEGNSEPLAKSIASNSEGIQIIQEAFGVWTSANSPANGVTVQKGASLGVDVNNCNAADFLYIPGNPDSDLDAICGCVPDPYKPAGCTSTVCHNPIVFDANGDITAGIFGPGNRTLVLGFADAISYSEQGFPLQYVQSYAVVNGVCLDDSPDPLCNNMVWDTNDIKSTMIHELGHALGLAHSQLNLCVSALGNPCVLKVDNTFDPLKAAQMPMMFPYAVPNLVSLTLTRDDMVGLAALYPKNSPTCTAIARVLKNGQTTGLACTEVVLRDPTGSTQEALSGVSGSLEPNAYGNTPTAQGCTVDPNNPMLCGRVVIEGLKSGTNYTIEVNPLYEGGSSSRIGQCQKTNLMLGNGLADSGAISCAAGKKYVACNCQESPDFNSCSGDADLCVNLP